MNSSIPGVRNYKPQGFLSEFLDAQQRYDLLHRLAKEHGEIVQFRVAHLNMVYLNSPELVYELLVERPYDFVKGHKQAEAFRAVLGNAINISEQQTHQRQRRALAPAFQQRSIAQFAETIVEYTQAAQAKWADGLEFDLDYALKELTLTIIAKVMFDIDYLAPQHPLRHNVKVATGHLDHSLSRLITLPLSWKTAYNQQVKSNLSQLDTYVYTAIAEHKNAAVKPDDLLSAMLNSRYEDGGQMPDQQMRDEVVSNFIAGYDNSGQAIVWALYLLMQHPEIMAKIRQEAEVFFDQSRPADYLQTTRLVYTTQVFKEAIRVYPTTGLGLRLPSTNTTLGRYEVKRSDYILFAPYVMHRQEAYFPNPERFDPERFTSENEKKLPRCTYMPFGAGPRICIGNHFSLMEAPLILAILARNLSFELVPNQSITPVAQSIMRPKNGIKVVVKRHQS